MGCCTTCQDRPLAENSRLRKALWIALAINATMFFVEATAGMRSGSSSLAADALDFLGDAANYTISLAVFGAALRRRAQAAIVKGATMGLFGIWVAGSTIMHFLAGTLPAAEVMGGVGLLALVANLGTALMLYAFRGGDSNMRSVWICSRNDALGNLAVLAAAGGVHVSGTGWPDMAVALIMAGLAVTGAIQILRQAVGELAGGVA